MRNSPLIAFLAAVMSAALPMGGCATSGHVVSPNAGPAIVEAAFAALGNGLAPWPSWTSWKLSLYGGPDGRTYLGCLWCEGDRDSVLDPDGRFGRKSARSILNRSSVFGHPDSSYSPCNWRGTTPPLVISSGGTSLGRLTINTDLPDAVKVESITTWIAGACAGRSGTEATETGNAGHGVPQDDTREVASDWGAPEQRAEGAPPAGFAIAPLSTVIGGQQLFPELTGFMLTVQRTSDGVEVTCEAGCRWQSMTPAIVRCSTRKPCLRITDTRAGARASAEYAAFAVTVDLSSTGMALACERGCAWKTRELDCEPVTPCSVRISEYGVNRAKPGAKVR